MEKVKITKIYRSTEDKNGNKLVNKNGIAYTRLSLKTLQHGEKYLSGFGSKENENWKEGDEVEIIIKQNGEYLNFETPKKDDKAIEMLSQILTKLGTIGAKVDFIYNNQKITGTKGETVAVNPFQDEMPEYPDMEQPEF